MTQITINIEDKSILPHLKGILKALKGVSIAAIDNNAATEEKMRLEIRQSLEEVKESINGNVSLPEAKDIVF